MKIGYVRAVYGVISTSPLDVYRVLSRKLSTSDYTCELVDYGTSALPDCDIAVFNGVKTYVDCAPFLHSRMIAVVCGGPLQVDTLQGVIPLDYDKTLSYLFNLKPIDYAKVIKPLRKYKLYTPLRVKKLKINHLAMVLDNTATGGQILTEWNKLLSVLNMTARNKLRTALVSIFTEDKPSTLFAETCGVFLVGPDIKERLLALTTKMNTKQFKTLVSVLKLAIDKTKPANVKSLAKKNSLEEFEINFFKKMIQDERSNASKNYYDAVNVPPIKKVKDARK